MSRVIHFDLSAEDPERAAEFYRGVFNWKVNKWEGPEDYWLIQTGTDEEPGVTGGVAGRIKPDDSTAVVFDVESVDETFKKVIDADGTIREEKKAIPGVGYLLTRRSSISCSGLQENVRSRRSLQAMVTPLAKAATLS